MSNIELFICIRMDLALNNLQSLICHKTETNKQKKNIWDIYLTHSLRLTVTSVSENDSRGIIAKVLDSGLEVSVFELQ